ncbi:response regulator (plasmid) [Ensifer adhaerens]|uniref:response regulator n=1 Tax=Ensifer adhaerens TaxID=106592 RepID=UPI001CBD1DC2|nr:response regulator [Ensifer adhaerens]MBZ7927280.1 response regulator [Ensifer adhaerens]UAX98296.1 response regulator [Ensifer adhaerens]UAY05678.1 response regulator [Ensifer adhaerens]UAY13056.1 response regulator [Ensifer adhaerens]
MDQDAYNWISRRAHEIWQQEGCPDGRDREHWNQAVSERDLLSKTETTGSMPPIETVLVVEDDPLIRFATVDALEGVGLRVLEAGSADEAMALLQSAEIDALFTDINMPGSVDGLVLVQRVRATAPQTRVIVTSGHVMLGAFDLASGVSFLPKPYSYEALIKMLIY